MINIARWKVILVLALSLLGAALAAPNLLDRETAEGLPAWLPHKQVVLGLDLQGGSHLLLEVDVGAVIRERLETVVDSVRTALRKGNIRYGNLGVAGAAVQVTIRDLDRLEEARKALREIDRGLDVAAEDGGRITLKFSEQEMRDRRRAAVEQSVEIVRRRIDETGTREPTIQQQGDDRILVQLPGVRDPERIKALLGKTAKMTFHLLAPNATVEDALAGRIPPGAELLPAVGEADPATGKARLYVVQKRVMVSGDSLIDAQPSFDSRTNEPVVSFRFDTVGARKFGDVTKENVGRPFAIVLDGKVISAPVIREPILTGNGQISGDFTVASAKDLALLLRAGALPAPLTVLEERSVGPDLGADSIAAGKVASLLGLVLVVLFMFLFYGLFGLFANAALAINLVLLLGAMSALGATLTLPGIAGIVLTMGMAVDANVLIYERMREEARLGRTPFSAVDAGFQRAFVTILDSNLTTLIAAVLLFQFGSGPVRGFAVTLGLGLLTSMFCAIWVTRLMIVAWLRRARPAALPI
jgi:preprotein translocase subunit SecD